MIGQLKNSLQLRGQAPLRAKFKLPKMIDVSTKITELHHGAGKLPTSFELEALERRFKAALAGDMLASITNSDWKKAPWVLWFQKPYLAQNDVFMEKFHEVLVELKNPKLWKRLIHVYLRDCNYHEDRSKSDQMISTWIKDVLKDLDLSPNMDAWKLRHDDVAIFDTAGHIKAADQYIRQASTKMFWEELGLVGELETGAYSVKVAQALLLRTSKRLTSSIELAETTWQYLMKDDDTIRFPSLRADFINSLLEPWANAPVPEALGRSIRTRLLVAFKDPRFRSNAGAWSGVSTIALSVMRKWLAAATIDQFFDIMDDIDDPNQWAYRRAFWTAYIRNQMIDDAIVALGSHGRAIASRILERDAMVAAKLDAPQPQHCVLLMKVGDLIIAEFNQNGKCRFWKSSHRKAPSFLPEQFHYNDLCVNPPECSEALSHAASTHYTWQRKFREYIYKNTGYTVNDSDFKVK